jgi:hypothetical protein
MNPLFVKDIIKTILNNLPIYEQLRAKRVCKYWRDVLFDPELQLVLPHQKIHYYECLVKLENYRKLLNNSIMGSGKTHTTGANIKYLYRKGKIRRTVVVGPKSMCEEWEKYGKQINLTNLEVFTYAYIRGKNCEFLDNKKEGEGDDAITTFYPSEKWVKYVEEGVALVFDECHNLKNKTDQTKAALAMLNQIYKMNKKGNESTVFFLSATPIDNEKQASTYCYLFGFVDPDKHMGRQDIQRGYVLEGLEDLIENVVPKRLRDEYRGKFLTNIQGKHSIIFDIYQHFIQTKYCLAMPCPDIKVEFDIRNGFYKLPNNLLDQYNQALIRLKNGISALNAIHLGHFAWNGQQDPWVIIAAALGDIERVKVDILKRVPLSQLNKDKKCKVVLVCNRNESVEVLKETYKAYNPLILTGKVNNRSKLIAQFQDPNGPRVLIGNVKVLSLGINLHDTDGKYPRYLYCIPSYMIVDMYQVAKRIHRQGGKSKATVRYIYGPGNEPHLLTTIARRSDAMKKATVEEIRDKVKYPGDYAPEVEQ